MFFKMMPPFFWLEWCINSSRFRIRNVALSNGQNCFFGPKRAKSLKKAKLCTAPRCTISLCMNLRLLLTVILQWACRHAIGFWYFVVHVCQLLLKLKIINNLFSQFRWIVGMFPSSISVVYHAPIHANYQTETKWNITK